MKIKLQILFLFQLKSDKIAFVMPAFTMTVYDNYKGDPFSTFYKKYAFVNENEFVTTDLHLLSANVPNITENFLYIQSNGYNILGTKFHILNETNNDAEKI